MASGWDAYLAYAYSEKTGSKATTGAAIYGLDGAKWAAKGEVAAVAGDIKNFVNHLKGSGDAPSLQVNPSTRLMFLGKNQDCITGKKGEIGGAIAISNKACVICLVKGPPQDAVKATLAVVSVLKSRSF